MFLNEKISVKSGPYWCMLIMPGRQDMTKFWASLGYIGRFCLQNKKDMVIQAPTPRQVAVDN